MHRMKDFKEQRQGHLQWKMTFSVLSAQVETEGLRRSIQNLGVLLTTAAVAHTSVATGEGLRHAATGQHHTITVTTKDKVLTLN